MDYLPQDFVDDITSFENGNMDNSQIPEFFQMLLDTGAIIHLQGNYHRIAQQLVNAGVCHVPSN
jgi:hypothetical protein